MSGTENKIKNTCKGANITDGLAVNGSKADAAKNTVDKWISEHQ